MKRMLMGLGLVTMIFLLVGCNEIQDDLVSYLNEDIAAIAALEEEATSAYTSVTGVNYTDDLALYNALTTTILPTYEEFVLKLQEIEPETEEVQELHELFVEGVQDQYEGMELLVTAIEMQDENEVDQADVLLVSGASKIEKYNERLEELADENCVELEDR